MIGYYREQCARADAVLARTEMSAPPRGNHGVDEDGGPSVPSVRWVVLHMIEETAAHSDHLEIAGELLDDRTNLGQR